MILEFLSAFFLTFAALAAVFLNGFQAFCALMGLVALALIIAYIAVRNHERRSK